MQEVCVLKNPSIIKQYSLPVLVELMVSDVRTDIPDSPWSPLYPLSPLGPEIGHNNSIYDSLHHKSNNKK